LLEVLSREGNVAERPTSHRRGPSPTFRKKFINESVSEVGVLKPKLTGKQHSKNTKNNLLKTNKLAYVEYRNIRRMGTQFLHLACQVYSHRCTPVIHTTVVDLCCIRSLCKCRITGIQSYKTVFLARPCNIQCILHQSCPMKTRNFTPGVLNFIGQESHIITPTSAGGREVPIPFTMYQI